MTMRSAILVLLTATAVASAPAPTAVELYHWQVRAEYVNYDTGYERSLTTLSIVNRSLTRTIYLDDVLALGPDGLDEVIAVHTGLNGVGIPPLGSIELPVDPVHFPGLQYKLQPDQRGVESVLVSYSGTKEAFRLTAKIDALLPGESDSRVLVRVDGHPVIK